MSHTPRGSRTTGRHGRSGTLPPVPGRSASFRSTRAFTALTSLLALLLCTGTTWQIAVDGPLRSADERLGDALRHSAPPAPFTELLADLGNMPVALAVLAAALAWAGYRSRQWRLPAGYALAMAAVPVVVSLLKTWLDRPGPLGGTGYYPSGHAATAAVAFGGASLLLLPYARERWPPAGWALPCAAALGTAGNGVGLVWRGYHWPLDVLASWCLGWLLLAAATTAARAGPRRPWGPRGARGTRDARDARVARGPGDAGQDGPDGQDGKDGRGEPGGARPAGP